MKGRTPLDKYEGPRGEMCMTGGWLGDAVYVTLNEETEKCLDEIAESFICRHSIERSLLSASDRLYVALDVALGLESAFGTSQEKALYSMWRKRMREVLHLPPGRLSRFSNAIVWRGRKP